MISIAKILERKGSNVIHVPPHLSVHDALVIMNDKNIGSLVVMHDGQYQGIVTERDYARKVVLKGKNSKDTSVSEIMENDFPPLSPTDSLERCMQLMTGHNLRYLPVMENGNIVGLIGIMDVVFETILAQQETISELHQYISGSAY